MHGTLQAKLFTKDLSSDSSRCIQYGSFLLSPCDFQSQAGKAAARNWKNLIRYMDKPLSRVLESFVAPDGKRCCRFVGSVASTLVNLPLARSPGSQPPDSPSLDTGLADASKVSQSQGSSASTSPRAPVSPPDHVRLPDYHPITPPHFTGVSLIQRLSASLWTPLIRRLFTGRRIALMCLTAQLTLVSVLWLCG